MNTLTVLSERHTPHALHLNWTAGVACGLILAVVISFVVSLVTGDWGWFQRSGALLTLPSAAYSVLNTRFGHAASVAVIVGTLIWSYGDLLGNVFPILH